MADVEAMEIEHSSKETLMEVDIKSKEIETKKEGVVVKSVAGSSKPKGFELPW